MQTIQQLQNDPNFLAGVRQRIQDEMGQPREFILLQILHAPPVRPREGIVVAADGIDWDPGSGPGAYMFDGTNWRFLWSSPASGIFTATRIGNFAWVSNTESAPILTIGGPELGTWMTGISLSDQEWTLPASPIDGAWVGVLCGTIKAGAYLRITANGSQEIQLAAGASAGGGYVRSNVGRSFLVLQYSLQENCWLATSQFGTWTIDS